MKYVTYPPSKTLSEYVRFFWTLEGEATFESPYIHRSMADGCAELLFHYNGVFDELKDGTTFRKSFQSGIAAQSQKFSRFKINRNFGMFGVYLYPYAISQLFSVPATWLKNEMVELEDILGDEGVALEEKIMLATDDFERIKIMTAYLEGKISKVKNPPPGVLESIRFVLQTKGLTNIEELANRNFLSIRQFERKFKHFTGFSPKFYSRIVRFQTTLGKYNNQMASLTDIAYEAGYYDQSHFIQEFKSFSGLSPKLYFSGKSEASLWRD